MKRPPVVRLPPKSNLEYTLSRGAQISAIFLGFLGCLFVLQAGRFLLVPVSLAVIVGLMLGPVSTRLEYRGMPPALSAVVAVLVFLLVITGLATAVAAPLTTWADRVPQIWSKLQLQLISLREPLATIESFREEIRSVTGESNVTVSVDGGSPVENVAYLAPTLLAQMLIFLASLYFFIATRHQIRNAILTVCYDRRLRWRVAHIFRDVESQVSSYLLAIALINTGLALAVSLALWLVGVPSPLLWGVLAGILNFVIYVGPMIMAVILLGVGLASFDSFSGSLLPPLIYLSVNAMEAQFVTPMVIGKRMTLNPFIVFLAIAFWLWIWGPVGGFIAVPTLLIMFAIFRNILPGVHWNLPPEGRRNPS